MKQQKVRIGFLILLTLFVVLSRLIPHPINFTPVIAIALFSGAYVFRKRWAFLLPVSAMILSDLGLYYLMNVGFFPVMRIVVYSSLVVLTTIGFFLRGNFSLRKAVPIGLAAPVLFFLLVNTADWGLNICAVYPEGIHGFIACNVSALGVFDNLFLSTCFYAGMMFGAVELGKQTIPGRILTYVD